MPGWVAVTPRSGCGEPQGVGEHDWFGGAERKLPRSRQTCRPCQYTGRSGRECRHRHSRRLETRHGHRSQEPQPAAPGPPPCCGPAWSPGSWSG